MTLPLASNVLPVSARRHVDVQSPSSLRMMAAKGLVPLASSDMVTALYLLTDDPEEEIRAAARNTARSLPDRVLASAFRDEGVKAPVLDYFLAQFFDHQVYAEMLVLNGSTSDVGVASVADRCPLKTAEVVAHNQLRLLRHEDIIRALCRNPSASSALLDGVCDFAVRSGVKLFDVTQMNVARERLFGPQGILPGAEGEVTAENLLNDFRELVEEKSPPMEEGKRLNLTQRVLKMSIAEKIKLATLGNKEARGLLMRDSNKLVAVAVIRSPRITDGEVMLSASNRTVNEEVLRIIYSHREWSKDYPIKLALVKNPKTPLTVSMKFLATLRDSEVRDLARNKNVPSGIQMHAKKMVNKKAETKGEG